MGRFMLAALAAATVVLSGPFVGEFNTSLLNAFPDQHVAIVVAAVVVPAVAAFAVALFRIRTRRLLRYGAIALALSFAGGYAAALRPSYTEQFHLTEYGVLAFLFYRVWHDRADVTSLVMPVAAALMAGLADEWFQWFVPARVGELRDVALNGVGIAAGLLVAVALQPPMTPRRFADDRSRRMLAGGLAALVSCGAVFRQSVHMGYKIEDPAIGSFRSRYDAATLQEESRDRTRRWPAAPPGPQGRISREDHYLSEAMDHVRRRNDAVAASDFAVAWPENLILDRYCDPVLLYGAPGSRWPAEQRAQIAAAVGAAPAIPSASGSPAPASPAPRFVSDASALPIYVWPRPWLWGATAVVLGALAMLGRSRARAPQPPVAA